MTFLRGALAALLLTSILPAQSSTGRAIFLANCSFCHRPNSTGRGNADYRFQTPLKMAAACNADPTEGNLGIQGAKLIAPGAPDKSIVSRRMHALDSDRMPPLGTVLVDVAGSQVIDDWITSLMVCP